MSHTTDSQACLLKWLEVNGANSVGHASGTLLSHWRNVVRLLAGWRVGPDVVAAALLQPCRLLGMTQAGAREVVGPSAATLAEGVAARTPADSLVESHWESIAPSASLDAARLVHLASGIAMLGAAGLSAHHVEQLRSLARSSLSSLPDDAADSLRALFRLEPDERAAQPRPAPYRGFDVARVSALAEFLNDLPSGSHLLDACGGDSPARVLAQGRLRRTSVHPSRDSSASEQCLAASLFALPFASARFDAAVALWPFALVERGLHAATVSEIARVMRPGGAILLTTDELEASAARGLVSEAGLRIEQARSLADSHAALVIRARVPG